MTDDLGMDALGGTLADRGAKALAAGCDILLHCSGFLKDPAAILSEMEEIATAAGSLGGETLNRANAADGFVSAPQDFDTEQAWARFGDLMSQMEARA